MRQRWKQSEVGFFFSFFFVKNEAKAVAKDADDKIRPLVCVREMDGGQGVSTQISAFFFSVARWQMSRADLV